MMMGYEIPGSCRSPFYLTRLSEKGFIISGKKKAIYHSHVTYILSLVVPAIAQSIRVT